jgi:hypothetical protein
MEFSEANNPWRSVPEWVAFLIEFGYRWMDNQDQSRRLALISMPTDSAASGLITLGLMRKCMELDDANDIGAHYQRLLTLAHTRPHEVTLRHIRRPGRYAFDGFNEDGDPMVKRLNDRRRRRVNIHRLTAKEWHIFGEAPVVVREGQQLQNVEFYTKLVAEGGEIRAANLSESYSNVCLAGRATGEAPTKGWMTDIRFRENGCEANLSQLLTVQNWMPRTTSRVRFYNSRTEAFDRESGTPQVVVADGDASFLKILASAEFENCDVIGVLHRTIEREKLEAVGTKLSSLRQWYRPDDSLLGALSDIPRGVTISVLRRGI